MISQPKKQRSKEMKLFDRGQNLNPRIPSPDPLYSTTRPSLNSIQLYERDCLPAVNVSFWVQEVGISPP